MNKQSSIFLFLLFALCKLLSQPLSISTESITSQDGLSQNSVVKIFQDSRQFLWFGRFDGINRYDGYTFRVYKTTPETDQVTLSYNQNVVTSEFAARHYASPKNNKYAYYLKGLESNWNHVENQKYAIHTNLPAGDCVLRIKVSNNNGVWNEKGIPLKATIIPPFWDSLLFKLGTALFLLFIIVAGYKRLIHSIEKRRFELEKLNDLLRKENLELQKSEEKVKEYAEELKLANKTKDNFFSIIAHDLKNPFFILMGFSNLIISEYDELTDQERLFYVEQIRKSAELSHQLLQNLLQWSRSQMGRIGYSPQRLDLQSCVIENLEFVKASAQNKEIKIECSIEDGISVEVDMDMINTIFRNLLTNSIKYSNKGDFVNVTSVLNGKNVTVCVSDTGIGMNEKIRSNLFKIDVHQSSEGTANEQGTGLGLLLCKEFIVRHGGEIWVESEENVGSKFYFKLPLAL